MNESVSKKCVVEPIRGSVAILGLKLALMFFILDGVYGIVYYLIALGINLPLDLHHHIMVALTAIFLVKVALQIYFIFYVFLQWANDVSYITGNELVKRKGAIMIKEEVYKFDSIRSVTVVISFLGKIFGYGDMLITAIAGGNERELVLSGVSNPQKYEKMLRDCCKKLGD